MRMRANEDVNMMMDKHPDKRKELALLIALVLVFSSLAVILLTNSVRAAQTQKNPDIQAGLEAKADSLIKNKAALLDSLNKWGEESNSSIKEYSNELQTVMKEESKENNQSPLTPTRIIGVVIVLIAAVIIGGLYFKHGKKKVRGEMKEETLKDKLLPIIKNIMKDVIESVHLIHRANIWLIKNNSEKNTRRVNEEYAKMVEYLRKDLNLDIKKLYGKKKGECKKIIKEWGELTHEDGGFIRELNGIIESLKKNERLTENAVIAYLSKEKIGRDSTDIAFINALQEKQGDIKKLTDDCLKILEEGEETDEIKAMRNALNSLKGDADSLMLSIRDYNEATSLEEKIRLAKDEMSEEKLKLLLKHLKELILPYKLFEREIKINDRKFRLIFTFYNKIALNKNKRKKAVSMVNKKIDRLVKEFIKDREHRNADEILGRIEDTMRQERELDESIEEFKHEIE